NLRGEARGDRRTRLVAALSDVASRTCGVTGDNRFDAQLADDAPALAERMDVAFDRLDVLERGAAHSHQLVPDRQEPFTDDEQAGMRQQVMDVGNTAGDRVFDRNH